MIQVMVQLRATGCGARYLRVFREEDLYGGDRGVLGVEDILFKRARPGLATGGDRGINRAPYL